MMGSLTLRWRAAMYRKSILLCTGVALLVVLALVLGSGFMTAQDKAAQEKTAKDPKRDADTQAIDKLVKEMIEAFNNRDAAAIAARWTDDSEFIANDGEPIRGRSEIQKGYAEYFKTLNGKPRVEVQTDGLRFPSANAAISEVTLRLKNDEGEVIASSWRNTLVVREGGEWKVAIVREWDRDVGLDVGLKELDWLIGTWQVA